MKEPVTLNAGDNSMEVFPRYGGALGELRLCPAAGSGAVSVLVPDTPDELPVNPWFRNRILFPFCDRIRNGVYRFGGKIYRLPKNENGITAIHGLIYDRPGRVLSRECGTDFSELVLEWVLGDAAGYPFGTALVLTYRLYGGDRGTGGDGGTAELDFTAENRGNTPAPVGFGWHPYVRLPGTGADGLTIRIPADSWVEPDADLFPTGRIRPVTEEGGYYDFRAGKTPGGKPYDIAFPLVRKAVGGTVTASISSRAYTLTVEVGGAFDFLQLFTPPDRRSIALEPFTCATEAFNRDDMGMRILSPGESLRGTVRLQFASTWPVT